jgi:hypothetical protein
MPMKPTHRYRESNFAVELETLIDRFSKEGVSYGDMGLVCLELGKMLVRMDLDRLQDQLDCHDHLEPGSGV